MSPRIPLPPPPPPVEVRSWPDREALLADRARALDALGRRLLGGGRFALFAGSVLTLQLGWGMVGMLLADPDRAILDPFTLLIQLIAAVLGLGVLVPGVWLVVRGVRQDRVVRERFLAWAALDRDAAADARLRRPVQSACWMLLSAVLCGLGLWLGFAVPAGATPAAGGHYVVAYGMGVALIFWINGLIGLFKAVGHYRTAIRIAPPARAGRSASSAPPRHV
ncbi:hypothetical protein ACF1BN_19575 [Streptomyces sp. NPDC014861]|uniref:hypothetical protein n=1 Tax=Streptomyces sp. NPDC014861 TaxID=3364923 RepID=UPI0036F650D7